MGASTGNLTFDSDTHTYFFNGKRVKSVTQILAAVTDFSMVQKETLEWKRQLGTAVHLATELYDQNDLDFSSIDKNVEPYLDAWAVFKADSGIEILEVEQRIFHPVMMYAGTLDRIGLINGEVAVLDIKTSSTLSKTVGMQLAAYQEAIGAINNKKRPIARYAVQLKADGTYRLQKYEDKRDFMNFVSLKNMIDWADTNGTRIDYDPNQTTN